MKALRTIKGEIRKLSEFANDETVDPHIRNEAEGSRMALQWVVNDRYANPATLFRQRQRAQDRYGD